MSKWAVIYSSITGNTKDIAEVVAKEISIENEVDIFRVENAPNDLGDYEAVVLAYWLRRGGPDELMKAYMPTVKNTRVILISTHGTMPNSEHAMTAAARAGYALGEGNNIIGIFGCMGKLSTRLIEKRLAETRHNDPHLTEEKMARRKLAMSHPDDTDRENARKFIRRIRRKIGLPQQVHKEINSSNMLG